MPEGCFGVEPWCRLEENFIHPNEVKDCDLALLSQEPQNPESCEVIWAEVWCSVANGSSFPGGLCTLNLVETGRGRELC